MKGLILLAFACTALGKQVVRPQSNIAPPQLQAPAIAAPPATALLTPISGADLRLPPSLDPPNAGIQPVSAGIIPAPATPKVETHSPAAEAPGTRQLLEARAAEIEKARDGAPAAVQAKLGATYDRSSSSSRQAGAVLGRAAPARSAALLRPAPKLSHFQGRLRWDSAYFGEPERAGERDLGEIAETVRAQGLPMQVAGISFFVDARIVETLGAEGARATLERAIEVSRRKRGAGFADELAHLASSGRPIALALLDRSTHLLANHEKDDLIGASAAILERISNPRARDGLLATGWTHELRHEAGHSSVDEAERDLSAEDSDVFHGFVPDQAEAAQARTELLDLLEPDSLFLFELRTLHQESLQGPGSTLLTAATISPDGNLVATGGAEAGKVRVWRVEDAILREALPDDPKNVIHAMAFDPSGTRLAVSGRDGGVRVLTQEQKPVILRGHEPIPGKSDDVRSVSFSPDGRLVAGGSEMGDVRVWRLSDGALLRQFPHPGSVLALAFSPNGRSLATVDRSGAARIWDLYSGASRLLSMNLSWEEKKVSKREYETAGYGVTFSPDGRRLVTSGPDGHRVRIWDTSDSSLVQILVDASHPAWINQLAFSHDGRLLSSADIGGEVQVWDTKTSELLLQHLFGFPIIAVRFEDASHRLLVFDQRGNMRELDVPLRTPTSQP